MENADILIRGGRVIDPVNGVNAIRNITIKDGRILSNNADPNVDAKTTFDADGCLVTPGLIDAHVHCYEYATPLGVNPDRKCLARGVTTVIDAGSSGASTFMGLRKYIIDQSKTRVRCLLHIALHGLAAAGCAGKAPGGESDTLAILDEEGCRKCILDNRDVIVGVKVRLDAFVCDNGRNENEAYRRALAVAEQCKVPLMTHHANSTVPVQRRSDCMYACPGDLRPGDIYTHTYHAHKGCIVDPITGNLHDDVIDARKRGVIFDVGHGAGALNWKVAEIAAENGFWPDLLGSDLHTVNEGGPVYDLPTVMTKFLHLGMPLVDIIRSVTSSAASAYGLDDEIGSITPGRIADVTVLRIDDCDVMLEDTQGQVRNVRQRIVPVAVWREGERYPIQLPNPWPDNESREKFISSWDTVLIKDKNRPT